MDPAIDTAFPTGSCPHVAMLLSSREEVAPALASFYALGAKRNGWLYHRSLAGQADADRAELAAAGLDVERLEAEGRMVFAEIESASASRTTCTPGSRRWRPRSPAATRPRGGPASRSARTRTIIERSVEYDAAWDEHFHGRPCVSLCLFIVGDVDRDQRAAQIAANHDTLLSGPVR